MLHSTIIYRNTADNADFTINDQTSMNANWASGNPYYISVDSVDGLYGGDISYESHDLPNLIGEKSGDVFRRGKTITLSGTIWGAHLGGLDLGAFYLMQMFWETSGLRKLKFYPVPGGAQVYIKCRVNQDLSISKIKPQEFNYRWLWTVGLRADDPRIYNVSGDTVYQSWMT